MKYTTYIWFVLIALSLFAYILAWIDLDSFYMIIFLFLGTFIKGKLVIDYFMGLSNVRLKYKIIPTMWLFVVIVSIALIYHFPLLEKRMF